MLARRAFGDSESGLESQAVEYPPAPFGSGARSVWAVSIVPGVVGVLKGSAAGANKNYRTSGGKPPRPRLSMVITFGCRHSTQSGSRGSGCSSVARSTF